MCEFSYDYIKPKYRENKINYVKWIQTALLSPLKQKTFS